MSAPAKSHRLGELAPVAFPPSMAALALTILILLGSAVASDAGEINSADYTGLNNGFTYSGNITFGSQIDGVTLTFTDTHPTVTVGGDNRVLKGWTTTSLEEPMGMLGSWLSSSVRPNQQGVLPSLALPAVGSEFVATITSITNDYNYIQSDNASWTIVATAGNLPNAENAKVIVVDSNNFSIDSVVFRNFDITMEYHAPQNSSRTVVRNPFIGNSSDKEGKSLGDISHNEFNNITITLNDSPENNSEAVLAGGGILGMSTKTGDISISKISSNVFRNLTVKTVGNDVNVPAGPYIEGGGIIGLDIESTSTVSLGSASIDTLDGNIFQGINIDVRDIILGGGLVGVHSNSQRNDVVAYSKLGDVTGNVFGTGEGTFDINGNPNNDWSVNVTVGYSLRGGGVIGANAFTNADVLMENVSSNIFAGVKITTGSYIGGGGIIGLQTNDKATDKDFAADALVCDPETETCLAIGASLGKANDNAFVNISVTAGTSKAWTSGQGWALFRGGDIEGGGVIGLRSNKGPAEIGEINGNVFRGITIETLTRTAALSDTNKGTGSIRGGGIIGVQSSSSASIAKLSNNYFDDIAVSADGFILGGGVVGINAAAIDETTASVLQNFSNNHISNTSIYTAYGITGGGVVGVVTSGSATFAASIGFSGSIFTKINIETDKFIKGGGIIGFSGQNVGDNVILSSLIGNYFENIVVNTGLKINGIDGITDTVSGSYIEGGGIIGLLTNGALSSVGDISDNIFKNLTINSGAYIDGGGIIGVNGKINTTVYAGVETMTNNEFSGNRVTAENGSIMGGIFYSYGLYDDMIIQDSILIDNHFEAKISEMSAYASGTFDTGYQAPALVYGTVTIDTGLSRSPGELNTLVLTTSPDKDTVFSKNTVVDDWSNGEIRKAYSIYFGGIIGYEDLHPNQTNPANPTNPLFELKEDDPESDARLIISPDAGGRVVLEDPIRVRQTKLDDPLVGVRTFGMEVNGAGEFWWGGNNVFEVSDFIGGTHEIANRINFSGGSKTVLLSDMALEARKHKFIMESGARLTVYGSGIKDKPTTLQVSEFVSSGTIHFALNGQYVNDPTNPVLTIITQTAGSVNFSGATIELGEFDLDRELAVGETFYLVDAHDSSSTNNPGAFVSPGGADNILSLAESTVTVVGRGQATYTMTLGTYVNQDDISKLNGESSDGRFLSATITDVVPLIAPPGPPGPEPPGPVPPHADVVSESYTAGAAHVTLMGSWVAEHSYQAADVAIQSGGAHP
ncbi:MAG: hypothetical protein LBT40_15810, partial [Deltaproteobacteria bacterium]|nr:hypothetical protein [Deltaproteobacteria bacterium]